MKTKWYRRVGGKHVKFNLSKSGVTTSFKLGPITINPQRNSYFIKTGIPGLSLRGKLNEGTQKASTDIANQEAFNQIVEVFVELRNKLIANGITNLTSLINGIIKDINYGDTKSKSFINKLNTLQNELVDLENIEFEDKLYDLFEQLRSAKLGTEWPAFEIFIVVFFILMFLVGLA